MLARLVALVLLSLPAAASATWLRAETAAFIGYSRGGEKSLREAMRQLQDYDRLLRLLTAIDVAQSPAKLSVYFVSGSDLATVGIANRDVSGVYLAAPGFIGAFVATDRARNGGFSSANTVLFHEYTHHFMMQYTRAAYPAWYIEGFAEYLSTAKINATDTQVGGADQGRRYALVLEDWMPMRTVFTTNVNDVPLAQRAQFYALSWLAVHYLSRDSGRNRGLRAYLAAINAGTAPEKAFTAAFGVTYEQFGTALKRYGRSKEFTSSRLTGEGAGTSRDDPVVALAPLPASADALLVPAAALALRDFDRPATLDERATKLLATIRAGARSGDDFAELVGAEAEIKLGDRAFGIARLDARLARAPKDAQALYLRGMVALADAPDGDQTALRRARVWLTRANAARPDDYRILAGHARSFMTLDLPPGEVAVLTRAAELAPQVGRVAMFAALVQARKGDKRAAKTLLGPLANDPHGGSDAVAATQLIAAIDNGTLPADLTLNSDAGPK